MIIGKAFCDKYQREPATTFDVMYETYRHNNK